MVDSESQPDAAERAVDTLVERHKAIAILGPPLRQSAVAAAKRAQARGVPFISITTMPGLTGIGEYVFRNNLTLSDIGTIMAQYAYRSLGLRKFGVFSPTSRFGREQAKAFQREIERLGGKIVKRVSFSPRSRNLRPPLRKLLGKRYINRSKLRVSRSQMRKMKAFMRRRLRKKIRHMLRPLPPFEGLFVPEDARTGSQVAAYLTLLNMPLRHPRSRSRTKVLHDGYKGYKKIVLLGNHSWYHKDLFKAGKSYSKGATFCARFDRRGKSGKQFIRSYRRRFGKKPLHIDAYTYDAMRVLLQVASSGDARTRMAFRSALANVRYVGGPTGPFRFNEQGHAVGPARCFITGYGSFYGKTTLATVPTKRRDASSN
jgi:ABC-type branched-subunit amino acid transport system substrate-binding protein